MSRVGDGPGAWDRAVSGVNDPTPCQVRAEPSAVAYVILRQRTQGMKLPVAASQEAVPIHVRPSG